MPEYIVAVDVGGTFTDVYVRDIESDEVIIRKVPSNPAHPARAIIDGVLAAGIDCGDIQLLTHGTTVGTNALVTRSFPRTALITTRGFRDVLEIGRSTQPNLWDAYVDVTPPYIPRRDRFEVTERTLFDGSEHIALDEDDVRRIARTVLRRGIRSIGVSLINSYANGSHERRVAEILREEDPALLISLSSEVLPEIFEFERTSTTATNAVLGPVVDEYMTELVDGLREIGYHGEVLVLHSGGGVMSADTVTQFAARIAASGPAGGAVAMSAIATQCGFANAIGFDVGGTTSDVSLCRDGRLEITKDWGVEYGHPIAFPSIELITVGAGGGSIAWLDAVGALRSGPQSAGADPGPASYGRGGEQPTTTDANLVLGRIGVELIGGRSQFDVSAARRVIERDIAAPRGGLSVEDAADDILRVVTANMTEAIRSVSIERGLDPRDFALLAFGGGGPLHAVEVAHEANIPVVIIPPHPGVTSAVGCQMVDISHDISKTIVVDVEAESVRAVSTIFDELETEGRHRLGRETVSMIRIELHRTLEMRYTGQWRTISVPIPDGELQHGQLLKAFHDEHEREFSYSDLARRVEICGVRVTAVGKLAAAPRTVSAHNTAAVPKPRTHRAVYLRDVSSYVDVPVYDRVDLVSGSQFDGPCIVEQADTTAYIPGYARATADVHGNLIVRIGEQS